MGDAFLNGGVLCQDSALLAAHSADFCWLVLSTDGKGVVDAPEERGKGLSRESRIAKARSGGAGDF